MGVCLLMQGRAAEARVFAEKAVAADPNWNIANLALGMHQAREGQLLDAVRSANRALRLNPRAPSFELISIAFLKHRVGRTEEAVAMWERARAENPDQIFSRVGLVGVYESRGRHAKARAEVREILRVNPDLTAELVLRNPLVGLTMNAKARDQLRDQLRSAGLP